VITWLPFDLHPEYPPAGLSRQQLVARYGNAAMAHIEAFFASRGLRYNPHPEVVPNSRTALRLVELARTVGVDRQLHASLMDAYWEQARDIGSETILRPLALAAGLPAAEVEDVLATDRFLDVVEMSTSQAVSIGVTGVPAFLLDRRLLVLGAQPESVFERAFEQLGVASPGDP
jgi:predicted DsbA family dithiol-disulfide isomerase